MPRIHAITSLDDPRAAPFRNVRERDLRAEGVFLAEGALLAERLLASRFPIESLLVAEASRADFTAQIPDSVPVYTAPAAVVREIIGFDFHRGVLALARRLPFPDASTLIENTLVESEAHTRGRLRFIACPGTDTGENLGLIVRSARAFGMHGLLLPENSADPLSRRCLRQSMGGSLAMPIARSSDLLGELRALKSSHGLRLVAAVASPQAQPLENFTWPERSVLVVGNEFHGLDESWMELCDFPVTIPVAPDCDSLNVAVATGIFLHHMSASA
jgi:tRNA G18 (ribose-2'-O)-methylase SpoU